MGTKRIFGCILLGAAIVFSSCNNVKTKKNAIEADVFENEKPLPTGLDDEDIIFYNIFTPTDMSNLINNYSSFYKSNLVNSINNVDKYTHSTSKALNIGVYGADLNYLWVFEQNQQANSYIKTIQSLSEQLGVPSNFVSMTAEKAGSHTADIDTLKSIARVAYKDITNYLNNCGRGNNAALVLLGGWTETLYLAINMYNQPDAKMVSRIATQRFSLNIIINLLQNQQNDIDVSSYLVMLRKLRKAFDEFVIRVPQGCLSIDTVNKRIIIKDNGDLNFNAEQINNIRQITNDIRKMMIN
ncbi:MAG: hypothetical protein J6W13_09530 [Salinivirgaceae bacterium]|nr:hypothetical protein [Salinivirgaceae bacterium]